ncbi:MAG: Crp/Fnr family transcriptional regulator [Candidatus Competibacterales bacterium]
MPSQSSACQRCVFAKGCPLLQRLPATAHRHIAPGTLMGYRLFERDEALFRSGDAFDRLYVLCSGSAKLLEIHPQGTSQIFSFYFPRDVLGLDAVELHHHEGTAIALEATLVCQLSFEGLASAAQHSKAIGDCLHHLWSQEVQREYTALRLRAPKTAVERLALFLIHLAQHRVDPSGGWNELHLVMSRHDLGDYLGLSEETVSRGISALQHKGAIAADKRTIRLLDQAALAQAAGLDGEAAAFSSPSANPAAAKFHGQWG